MLSWSDRASCAPTSQCLGLPNSSSYTIPSQPDRAKFVAAFRERPSNFLPHWGGATGFASRLMTAARKRATFAAVVDVGCNTGEWSRAWLGRDGSGGRERTAMLLCIEALPTLAISVKHRLSRLPNAAERVHVINVALSNVSAESRPLFGLPSSSKTATTQTGAGLSHQMSEGKHVQLGVVPVQTLDHVLSQWRLLEPGHLFVKVWGRWRKRRSHTLTSENAEKPPIHTRTWSCSQYTRKRPRMLRSAHGSDCHSPIPPLCPCHRWMSRASMCTSSPVPRVRCARAPSTCSSSSGTAESCGNPCRRA